MSNSVLTAAPAGEEDATLFLGFELAKSAWLIGLYAPELSTKVSRHKVDGGDLSKVLDLIAAAKQRLLRSGKGARVRVVSIYEAGYDGFWLHRALLSAGVENRVIDAASVPVDRRARRVKTDRLDLEQLIRVLLALERGETRACRVVRVPAPDEEDAKRQNRERDVLVAERTAHTNRMTGMLMALGIRGVNARRGDFAEYLNTVRTGTGEPLPIHARQALIREHERLCLLQRQIKEIEAAQAAMIKDAAPQQTEERSATLARELVRLKGIGQLSAITLSREVFYRRFDNRREVASYFGLTPSPYRSGGMHSDQGISKAGNPRARTLAIELAWLWLRHQPGSMLTRWFVGRTHGATGRIRRIALVALARKLTVALWRYVTVGLVPEGAVMNRA
jgi:transposase